MHCLSCGHWLVERRTEYADGSAVVSYKSDGQKAKCLSLGTETARDFGCLNYFEAVPGGQVEVWTKPGRPEDHWVWVPCPDCDGKGSTSSDQNDTTNQFNLPSAICRRCAGTAHVRRYDDGFVGDEQTQLHKNEIERRKGRPSAPDASTTLQPQSKADVINVDQQF